MNNEFTRVLSLKSEKALNFFLKTNQYKNIELPVYFSFDPILNYVKEKIGDKAYKDCLKEGAQPEQLDRLNYDLLLNKDGHYATRPVMMANPYLYYFLSRELCREENWAALQELFKSYARRTSRFVQCPLSRSQMRSSTSQQPSSIGGSKWNNRASNCLWSTAICLSRTLPTVTEASGCTRLTRHSPCGEPSSKKLLHRCLQPYGSCST